MASEFIPPAMSRRTPLPAVWVLVFAGLPCAPAGGADTVGVAAFLADTEFDDFDGEAAVVSSASRAWDMNEELMTPRIDCSGRTGVAITWHHGYRSRTGQFVDVLVTLDGGTTFKVVYGDGISAALCPGVCVATPSGTVHNEWVSVDVSALADGRPDVRIAFRYYGSEGTDVPSANNDWYWAVEDVVVTTNEGEVFREGFDTPAVLDGADCADRDRWCILDGGDPADPGPLSTWYWGTATALPDGCDPSGNDCNENGIPDACELVANDCDGNGAPDECDLSSGRSRDCNGNGRPDRCEMAVGVTAPDGPGLCTEDCETDCNGNGIPDDCDVAAETEPSPDCNHNQRPDSCDLTDETFEAAALTAAIPPTGGGATTEVSLVVRMSSQVEGLVVTLDITHPSVHDLAATLVSPSGTEVRLFDHVPAVGQDFSGTTFDDAAAESIDDGVPPFTGSFRPVELLGALAGESTRGAWTLRVVDAVTGDTGSIDRFGLQFAASPDCNENGTPDACDLADGTSVDCDGNGTPDACDVAAGTSPDCNGNGIPDACDVEDAAGAVAPVTYDMTNGRTYRDEPYDGSGDAGSDGAALSGGLGQLVDGATGGDDPAADLGNGAGYEWVGWDDVQPAITFDFGKITRFETVSIHSNNAQTNGIGLFGSVELTFSNDGITFTDAITYTTTAAERADTSVRFIDVAIPRDARYVRAVFQDQTGFAWILISELRFTARAADCDNDGVPDECQIADNDCNGNAVLDACEPDCDGDGEPDACEIARGAGTDCNGNGIPDDCELADNDCNGNGVPDDCDLAAEADPSLDCNQNGQPDECELTDHDCNGNGVPDDCDVADPSGAVAPVTYDMTNGRTYRDEPYDGSGDANVDGAPLSGGLGQLVDGATGNDDPAADLGNGAGYEWVGWDDTQPAITFDFGKITRFETVSIHSNNAQTNGIGLFGSVELTFGNDGITFTDAITYTTTAAERADTSARFIDVAIPRNARYVRAVFQDQGGFAWILISELRFTARAADCDNDGVPDECQITGRDCNGNSVLDACEPDCDGDGEPDECEIASGDSVDCNRNGIPDACDITAGDSNDCNGDGVPDKCELAGNDCNRNALPDDCDIRDGTSRDDNGNAVPDECEP